MLYLCISEAYDLKCSSKNPRSNVSYVVDGAGNKRCYVSITPPQSSKPMAIMFWFHGSGGSARACGDHPGPEGKSWNDYAIEQGFVFLCGEAIDGKWAIPEVITNSTGTPCASNDTYEVDYLKNIIIDLEKKPELYDTSKIFTSGCSLGSAFSIYSSQCLHKWYPTAITSFMTHSTGLKIKGDGLHFPPDEYQPEYSWGECPKCQYFPARVEPKALNPPMKACIFDNKQDPTDNKPYFYQSSLQLESHWKLAGNPCESHYGEGHHCVFHSYAVILNCMDDGTRRLLPKGNIPTQPPTPAAPTPAPAPTPSHPTPAPAPTPSHPTPPPTPGSTPSPECIHACNQVCPNLEGKGETCESCLKYHQFDHVMVDNCRPTPWKITLDTFCDV